MNKNEIVSDKIKETNGFDIEKLPESQYLFGHFEITTFKMNNYKICDKGVTPDDLLKKAPLVFSGHFHHENSRKYGNKYERRENFAQNLLPLGHQKCFASSLRATL